MENKMFMNGKTYEIREILEDENVEELTDFEEEEVTGGVRILVNIFLYRQ